MSAARAEAAALAVELSVSANLTGLPAFPEKYFGGAADSVLSAADAADKAAGIYRVSLDAAIEAAAEAKYADAYPDYARYWKSEPDVVREVYRERVRGSVTAAVMGGAQ